jgi:hypothetical protein
MLPFWRLDPPFRFAVYIAFAVLFASGAAWLIADRRKPPRQKSGKKLPPLFLCCMAAPPC